MTWPGNKTGTEDVALAISGFNVVGAGSSVTANISVSHGTLTMSNMAGIVFVSGDGTADRSMVFVGGQTPVKDALNSLTYLGDPNFNGVDTFNGDADGDIGVFNITLSANNDAPVLTVPGGQTIYTDTNTAIGGITVNDVDVASAGGNLQLTLSVSHGTVTLSSLAGLSFSSGDGTQDAAMTFTGTLTNVRAALNNLTYRSASGYSGADTLSLSVSDLGNTGTGGALSDAKVVAISVLKFNNPPVLSVPGAQSGTENTPLAIAGISAADADLGAGTIKLTLSAGFGTLTLSSTTGLTFLSGANGGAAMTFTGTLANVNAALTTVTYQGNNGFNGNDLISITADDQGFTGDDGAKTDAESIAVTVNGNNDAPTLLVPGAQTVAEDASLTIAGIVAGDSDLGANPLQVQLSVTNGTISLNGVTGLSFTQGDGTGDAAMTFTGLLANVNAALNNLSYQGTANFNGADTLSVTVNDQGFTGAGGAKSTSSNIGITVTARNDTPSFVKGSDQTVLEDAGAQTAAGWATAISPGPANEAAQSVTFTVTNDNNALFLAQPAIAANGTLSFTPAADAFGTANVTVQAVDNGGTANGGSDTSPAQTFVITVTAKNDVPSFTKGADQTVLEDSGAKTVAGWATGLSAGPANEAGQTLSFLVSNDNNALFSSQPSVAANGTLTFTPAANANGVAVVTVQIRDNGGTANGGVDTSAAQTFSITVTAVNDAPSFTKGANQTVLEDSGAKTVAGWATAISRGAADEAGQTVSFIVSNDNNALFSSQPAVAANGTLTFTPAANANGVAIVTVQIADDGGTANGGSDTSAAQTFTVTVTAVNDVPSFTKGADQTVLEDSGLTTVAGWATALSAGPADESGQTLSFTVTNNNNALFSTQPAVAANGTLTFTVAANKSGTAVVSVTIVDNGGTANGGVNTSAVQTFNITVSGVNDPPVGVADSYLVNEDGTLNVAAGSGVLANDTDTDLNPLTAILVAGPTHGGLTLNADGSFTYTPDADYFGADSFTYKANDGIADSGVTTVSLTVNSVNDVPSFTKGGDQTVLEDAGAQTVAGWIAAASPGPANESAQTISYVVSNNNNGLFSSQPAIAADGTLTFTPGANLNGTAIVTVRIQDNGGTANGGVDLSAAQTFNITVTSVNDVPSFTKGGNINVPENSGAWSIPVWATAISPGPNEAAQTVDFILSNDDNSLFTVQPAVSAAGVLTFTLAANKTGTTNVSVQIHDNGGIANGGVDTSAAQTFTITVVPPTNNPPIAGADSFSVNEDGSLNVGVGSGILINDSDPDGNTIVATLVTAPANGSLTLNSNGSFVYTPNANFYGTDTFVYRASDGLLTSGDTTVTITVNAVNDVPSFTKGANQTVLEDSGAQTVAGWATAISVGPANESAQTHSFVVSNTNNGLFSVQPAIDANGQLTFTPAADANGAATVNVRIQDSGGTANGGVDLSANQSFTITVTSVNDVPSFVKGTDKTVLEDAGAQSYAGWATSISKGPINEAGQTVSFTVTNDNNALFSVQPAVSAAGTLSFTPAANANGAAVVSVVIKDNGGTANGGVDTSAVQTFNITVTSVNDVPSFTSGGNKTVLEDCGAQSMAWATAISAGPADESAQTLSFTVTNSNNALFAVQPAIAADGTLTFTPAADANGAVTVTVRIADNGGTANGGIDTSANQTFTLTITAVNDVPSFTKGADQSILEDAGAQTVSGWATALSNGPANESAQTLSFNVTNDNNALFAVQPAVSASGDLTYTPAANANGAAVVTVRIVDSGDTANGGANTSAPQTFNITIGSVNDAPVFTKGANPTVLEDSGAQTLAGWATGISAGAANEAAQTLSFQISNDNNALFSSQPALAANGTLSFTPAADANGTAVVTVRLTDNGGTANGGSDASADQTFTITVTAVNDVPSFTKGANQAIDEDAPAQTVVGWATGLSRGPADETGQTLSFVISTSDDSAFTVLPAVSAAGNLTYTPAPNANGVITVTVQIKDSGGTANGGVDTSAAQTFTITISSINDIPVFTPGPDQLVQEDCGAQTYPAWATGISAGAANESGQTLTFQVTNDNNALFAAQPAIAANGNLSFTPAANAHGAAVVSVSLKDNGGTANGGVDQTAVVTLTITVTSANDAPSFTKGADQTILENAGAQTVAGWATAMSPGPADEAAQTMSFVVTNSNNALFSSQPTIAANGTLSYTPAADANGTAVVTVRLQDSGGTANGGVDLSAAQTFNITVTSRNNAPSFTKGADQNVIEDCGAQTVAGWATAITAGPADEGGQALTFQVSNDNNALFLVQPAIAANGTLSYTPAANAFGTAVVTVTLKDDGGTANGGADTSAAQTFSITVGSSNDAPSFTKGADQNLSEDAGAQTVAGWATGMSAGPANEAAQTLSFEVTNDNNALFAVQPAVAANGTLSFTPAAQAQGSAVVSVRIRDNGGTANGGSDASAVQTFSITITGINDVPVFTKGADQSLLEDAGAQTVAGWATGISTGAANESGQTLTFQVTNDNNALFAVQPGVAANGTLTFTPAANAFGTAVVTVRLKDDGGTAIGGVDLSGPQIFTITVTAINDVPSFVKGADQNPPQDSGAWAVSNWATSVSAGPNEGAQTVSFTLTNDNNGLFTVQPAVDATGKLTFTLAAGVFGIANVSIRIQDDGGTANGGVDTSAVQTFKITAIPPLNHDPVAADDAYSVRQDAVLNVGIATGVLANDSDPDGNTIVAQLITGPANGVLSLQGNGSFQYTPNLGYSGPDSFTYRAFDGILTSLTVTVNITVLISNQAPSFTKGADQTLAEDAGAQTVVGWATAISPGPPSEAGQTLTFTVTNDNNALFLVQPAIAANGNLTFTPNADAFGTATVTVVLKDDGGTANGGSDTSAAQTFRITISSINDVPTFTKGGDQTVLEDCGPQTVSNWATAISRGAGNESGQGLVFQITTSDDAKFATRPAVAANGTLTFTPAANANGAVTVSISLKDDGGTANGGVDLTATETFTITVTGVNDAPVFVKGANVTVPINSGAYAAVGWATGISAGAPDEGGQTLSFALTNTNNALFAAQPALAANGNLSFTPAVGVSGLATVSIVLSDNGGTANGGADTAPTQTFLIKVSPLNSAPVGVADAVTVTEDVALDASGTLNLLANDTDVDENPLSAVLVSGPAHGTLTLNANGTYLYTPTAEYFGADSFVYRASDGVAQSGDTTVSITVQSANDVPSFTKGANQTVLEDAGAQTVAGWATGISVGPVNEAGQVLTFVVSTTNSALFAAGPAISAVGVLTYTPAVNASGSALVSVRLQDNGGTANGGVDLSATQTFTITVTPVNDPPAFTKGPDQAVGEDCGPQTVSGWATGITPGPGEAGQSTSFVVTNSRNSLFSSQPAVNAAGNLSFTPVDNGNGVATVSIELHDDGGTANGGVDVSAVQTFLITVNAVNDAPVLNSLASITYDPESPAKAVAPAATVSDVDNTTLTAATVQITSGYVNGEDLLEYAAGNGISPTWDAASGKLILSGTALVSAYQTALRSITYRNPDATPTSGTRILTWTVTDGSPSFGTSTARLSRVNVTPVNTAPSAVNDVASGFEDQTLTVAAPGLLTNDTDPEANPLTAVLNASPSYGTVTLRSNGSFDYAPQANFSGTDRFSYRANDGALDSQPATVTVMIAEVNDPPIFTAGGDVVVSEDSGAFFAAWATGLHPGTASEMSQILDFLVSDSNAALFQVRPALNAGGILSFTPAADASGTATVSVRLHDDGGTANGGSDTSSLSQFRVVVSPVNDAPSFTKGPDQTIVENSAGRVVPGWATAIFPGTGEAGQAVSFLTTVDNPGLFAIQPAISSTGELSFTIASDTFGTSTVSVRARDDGGTANGGLDTSAAQTFVISVTHLNRPPVLGALSTVNYPPGGAGVAASPLLTVTDSDGNSLRGARVQVTAGFTAGEDLLEFNNGNGITGAWATATGLLELSGVASITIYQAALRTVAYRNLNPLCASGVRTLTWTVDDGEAVGNLSEAKTSAISVGGANSSPTAMVDAYGGFEDLALTIPANGVLANDLDAEGNPLTARLISGPTNGSLTLNLDGSFAYLPAAEFSGTDLFSYVPNDGLVDGAPASVTLTIVSVNDPPTFTAGLDLLVDEDCGSQTVVWATALSPGPANEAGQILDFRLTCSNPGLFVTGPAMAPDGKLTFTPAANAFGIASLGVQLHDDGGTANGGIDLSASHSFRIEVRSVNDLPVAAADLFAAVEGTSLTATAPGVLANDTDIDGPASLTAELVSGVRNGTLTFRSNGSFDYVPAHDFQGDDGFSYRVFDGVERSSPASVTIRVSPFANPVRATDDLYQTSQDTPLTVGAGEGLLANDSDPLGNPLTCVLVAAPEFGSVSLASSGAFVYTPLQGWSGEARFTYRAFNGTRYSAIATVRITVRAAIVFSISPAAIDLGESASEPARIRVRGNIPASAPLTVFLTTSGTASAGADFQIASSVLIVAGQQEAEVEVKPVPDDLDEDDETILVQIATSPWYGVDDSKSTIFLRDDDVAGLVASETDGSTSVSEAGVTDRVSVVLSSRPIAEVVIGCGFAAGSESVGLSCVPTELRFTPDSWNQPQWLTLAVAEDSLEEGDQTASFTLTVVSDDSRYGSLSPRVIPVKVIDRPAAVGGTLVRREWLPEPGQGTRDVPISGVTLDLLGPNGGVIATTRTGPDGGYSFQVSPASYSLRFTDPTSGQLVTVFGAEARFAMTNIDPAGVVYDGISQAPVKGAKVEIFQDLDRNGMVDGSDSLVFQTVTGADGSYRYWTVLPSRLLMRVTCDGFDSPTVFPAPGERRLDPVPAGATRMNGRVTGRFVYDLQFSAGSGAVFDNDIPLAGRDTRLGLTKAANKRYAVIGDVITYSVLVQNSGGSDVRDAVIEDTPPKGFTFVPGRSQIDGAPLAVNAVGRKLHFPIGTVSAGKTAVLRYQMRVGTRAGLGKRTNSAVALQSGRTRISNASGHTIEVRRDPIFDEALVLGKVYGDRNRDGMQNRDETGLGSVLLMTEDGLLGKTDANGLFHLPGLSGTRHAVRIVPSSLPRGWLPERGDEVRILDLTPGLTMQVAIGLVPSTKVTANGHEWTRMTGEGTTNRTTVPMDGPCGQDVPCPKSAMDGAISKGDPGACQEFVSRGGSVEARHEVKPCPACHGCGNGQDQSREGSRRDWTSGLVFLGLLDYKAGLTRFSGDADLRPETGPMARDSWSEQRAAFFVRGTVGRGWNLTASYDSSRYPDLYDRRFPGPRPDAREASRHFPVFGDASELNRDAAQTRGPLFLDLERNGSRLRIGNFDPGFAETELTRYQRELSGESVRLVGRSGARIEAFHATGRQKAGHNEFLGTGGSLYYLKERRVVEGSEKVTIESRDPGSNLVLSTTTLQSGVDYELDAMNGRLLLLRPVSSSYAGALPLTISGGGTPRTFIIVDYEYETPDSLETGTRGGRISLPLGGGSRIGYTMISQDLAGEDFDLQGLDALIKLGSWGTIGYERADSRANQGSSFLSFDGGLSFLELAETSRGRGDASYLHGEFTPNARTRLQFARKKTDTGFVSGFTGLGQGQESLKVEGSYRLNASSSIEFQVSEQKLDAPLSLIGQYGIGADRSRTRSLTYRLRGVRHLLSVEWRSQEIGTASQPYQMAQHLPGDLVALRLDFPQKNGFSWFIERQEGLSRSSLPDRFRFATSIGFAKTSGRETYEFRKTFGPLVDGEEFRVTRRLGEGREIYQALTMTPYGVSGPQKTMVTGAKAPVGKRVDLVSEKRRASSGRETSDTVLLGLSRRMTPAWTLQFDYEHGTVQTLTGERFDRKAFALASRYAHLDRATGRSRLAVTNRLELQYDRGTVDNRHLLTQNTIEANLGRDFTVFTRYDVDAVRDETLSQSRGLYKELSFGLAYRPLRQTRFGFIIRGGTLEREAFADAARPADRADQEKYKFVAFEASYDFSKKLNLTQKVAWKWGSERIPGFGQTSTTVRLFITRLTHALSRAWAIAAEFRHLLSKEAGDSRSGLALEFKRRIGRSLELGVGWDFSSVRDDLFRTRARSQGPFIRLTGAFW